jgi:aspartate oxidase
VFAHEAALDACRLPKPRNHVTLPKIYPSAETGKERVLRAQIKTTMWEKVGIVRKSAGLRAAVRELQGVQRKAQTLLRRGTSYEAAEVLNMAQVGALIAAAASARRESRGCHYCTDYPKKASKARHAYTSRK